MFRDKKRYGQDPSVVIRSSFGTFSAPVKWKKPAYVFTCSWSDFFHREADAWRSEAWDIIRQTPHLTYQILTKRPERIFKCLPVDWKRGWANVWLGVTVESQKYINRIDWLQSVEARLRFVSCEPLLSDLFISRYLKPRCEPSIGMCPHGSERCSCMSTWYPGIDWVIAGSESGPKRRPSQLNWFRRLRDACQAADVPFFLKQADLGSGLVKMPELDGKVWAEMPVVGERT